MLENARDRGDVTDKLFASYVRGDLQRIPAGTREDAVELFFKLQRWYDAQRFSKVEVQVLLGGEDHGGILDFRFDDVPFELKCTFNIEQQHIFQTAAYLDLTLGGHIEFERGYIVQCTERLKVPTLYPVASAEIADWRIMLDCWRMVERRRK